MPSNEWELPSSLDMATYTVDAGRPVNEWVSRAAEVFRTNRLVVLQDFFLPSTEVETDVTSGQADSRQCSHDSAEVLSALHQQLSQYVETLLARDAGEKVLGNRSYQVGNAGRYTIGDWSSEPGFNMECGKTCEGHNGLGDTYLRAFALFVDCGGSQLLDLIGDYRLSSAGAQIVLGKRREKDLQSDEIEPRSWLEGKFGEDGLQSEFQALHLDLSDKYVPDDEAVRSLSHPPMLQFHITTQEITRKNGAMRILPNLPPRDKVYTDSREGREETDVERRSQLAPLKVGTAVLRDVQVWHGGCPNHDASRSARIWPFLSFYSTAFSDALIRGHRSGKLQVPLEDSRLLQPWRFSEAEIGHPSKYDVWRSKQTFGRARKLIADHLFPEKSPYRRWPRVVLQRELELIAQVVNWSYGKDYGHCPDTFFEECISKLRIYKSKCWGEDTDSFEKNILATLSEAAQDLRQWNLRHKACRNYCTSMENGKYACDYDSWCEAVDILEQRLLMLDQGSGDVGACLLDSSATIPSGQTTHPGVHGKRAFDPINLEDACKQQRNKKAKAEAE